MKVVEKSRKEELIDAIKNIEDERLIQQLLFHISPPKIIDRNPVNGISGEELKNRLKKHIDSLAWKE